MTLWNSMNDTSNTNSNMNTTTMNPNAKITIQGTIYNLADVRKWPNSAGWRKGPKGEHVSIARSAQLGEGVELGDGVVIGNWTRIGEEVHIRNWVRIADGVVIGDLTRIGESARIDAKACIGKKTRVDDGARIGDQAIIGDEACIGARARIGSRAVVAARAHVGAETNLLVLHGLPWVLSEAGTRDGEPFVALGCQLRPLSEWKKSKVTALGAVNGATEEQIQLALQFLQMVATQPSHD